jgi:hypothetical protein
VELRQRFSVNVALFRERIDRMKGLLGSGAYPRSILLELRLLRIGSEVALVIVPGELFAAIGRRIVEMSPFRHTLICTCTNGNVGYLPTREAYKAGGYEPHFAHFFYRFPELEPSVEDVLVDGARKLFGKLHS